MCNGETACCANLAWSSPDTTYSKLSLTVCCKMLQENVARYKTKTLIAEQNAQLLNLDKVYSILSLDVRRYFVLESK